MNKEIVELLVNELDNQPARTLLSEALADKITDNIIVANVSGVKNNRVKSMRRVISPFIPEWVKKVLKKSTLQLMPDYNSLVFRCFIISRMNRLLSEDSYALRKKN